MCWLVLFYSAIITPAIVELPVFLSFSLKFTFILPYNKIDHHANWIFRFFFCFSFTFPKTKHEPVDGFSQLCVTIIAVGKTDFWFRCLCICNKTEVFLGSKCLLKDYWLSINIEYQAEVHKLGVLFLLICTQMQQNYVELLKALWHFYTFLRRIEKEKYSQKKYCCRISSEIKEFLILANKHHKLFGSEFLKLTWL